MSHNKKLTEGSIFRSLVRLSIPLILTNILQTAYNLTDTFWVGRLGTDAVASVSISFPIIFIIVSLGMGIAIAGSIMLAQFKGAENQKQIDHVATQTLVGVFLISIVLALAGYFLSPFIIELMHTEISVYQDAVAYLKISFIGMIAMFIFMVFQSLMKSLGNVKLPFYIVLSTVLLNLILDPLFIFGFANIVPKNGVKGAAIATVFTQAVAALISIALLVKGNNGIHIRLKRYKPDWNIIKKLFKIGIPVSVEQVSRSLGMLVMIFLVSAFGTLAIASYGIGTRIFSFVIIPAFGLGMATSTLVGQNIGALKSERAVKTVKVSMSVAFIVLSILGILLYIFAARIAGFFVPNEMLTIQESAIFIRIISVSFGFVGILIVIIGALRGAGNTKLSMLLTIFSVWILRFPLAYFLSEYTHFKEIGIWLSYPATNILTAIVGLYIFKYGNWIKKRME